MDPLFILLDSALSTGSWQELSFLNEKLSESSSDLLKSCLGFLGSAAPSWKESLHLSYRLLIQQLLLNRPSHGKPTKKIYVPNPVTSESFSHKRRDLRFMFRMCVERMVLYARVNVEQQAFWKWRLKNKKFKLLEKLNKLKLVCLKKFKRDKKESIEIWLNNCQHPIEKRGVSPSAKEKLYWAILVQLIKQRSTDLKARFFWTWYIKQRKNVLGKKSVIIKEITHYTFRKVVLKAIVRYKRLAQNWFNAWKDIDYLIVNNISKRSGSSIDAIRTQARNRHSQTYRIVDHLKQKYEIKKKLSSAFINIWKNKAETNKFRLMSLDCLLKKQRIIRNEKTISVLKWKQNEQILKGNTKLNLNKREECLRRVLKLAQHKLFSHQSTHFTIWKCKSIEKKRFQMSILQTHFENLSNARNALHTKYLEKWSKLDRTRSMNKILIFLVKLAQFRQVRFIDNWKLLALNSEPRCFESFKYQLKPIVTLESNFKTFMKSSYFDSSTVDMERSRRPSFSPGESNGENSQKQDDSKDLVSHFSVFFKPICGLFYKDPLEYYINRKALQISSFSETLISPYEVDNTITFTAFKKPICIVYSCEKEIVISQPKHKLEKKGRAKIRSGKKQNPRKKQEIPHEEVEDTAPIQLKKPNYLHKKNESIKEDTEISPISPREDHPIVKIIFDVFKPLIKPLTFVEARGEGCESILLITEDDVDLTYSGLSTLRQKSEIKQEGDDVEKPISGPVSDEENIEITGTKLNKKKPGRKLQSKKARTKVDKGIDEEEPEMSIDLDAPAANASLDEIPSEPSEIKTVFKSKYRTSELGAITLKNLHHFKSFYKVDNQNDLQKAERQKVKSVILNPSIHKLLRKQTNTYTLNSEILVQVLGGFIKTRERVTFKKMKDLDPTNIRRKYYRVQKGSKALIQILNKKTTHPSFELMKYLLYAFSAQPVNPRTSHIEFSPRSITDSTKVKKSASFVKQYPQAYKFNLGKAKDLSKSITNFDFKDISY